ncbi:MAG: RES family NAD+ phosphorylase, partial [Bacteroidota bacterium]
FWSLRLAESMDLYRIAKIPYHRDLTGYGARLMGGRWNSEGVAVVYTSSSRALAALETIANTPIRYLTGKGFVIIELSLPDDLLVHEILEDSLPSGWESHPAVPSLARMGDAWVEGMRTPLMKVPSAVMHSESNYLINPSHPRSSEISILRMEPWMPDERFTK